MSRLPSDSGLAIGPILFVIAILGVMAAAMSSNIGSYSIIGNADRTSAEIISQANLIRTKINECNLKYGTEDNGDGYPPAAAATLVSALTCTGDADDVTNGKTIWTGQRQTMYPPAPKGFGEWQYINAGASGGRCFWTAPTGGNGNSGIVSGLGIAYKKFTSSEVKYISSSSTQKFVVFITLPTGAANANCNVP